ncbi:MAG: transcriptional repressor [bacterium]
MNFNNKGDLVKPKDEHLILGSYIKKEGLRKTPQREIILNTFLEIEDHVDVESLYNLVKQKDPSISFITIYRTLKLLCECNLAKELKLERAITKYEHKYNHIHHDHLICVQCGKVVEFCNEEIEKIQEQIALENKFSTQSHFLKINGLCELCKK